MPFGSLLSLKNWWLERGPPGSATRVVTTVVTTEGSAGFRKVPLYFLKDFPLGRFRRVPRGSAKVPQGSARFRNCFLKHFPYWAGSARFRRVPQGSAGFRRVPQGSAMAFLRISLAGQVPQGSARFRVVPRRFRGFRKVPLRFPFRFPLGFPEGSAKVPRGSADFFRFVLNFLKDFFWRFLKDS